MRRVLVIQTAFIGDVILTLPLVQAIRQYYPAAVIDVLVVPRAAEVFANHPDVSNIISYDKRGRERGVHGMIRLIRDLKKEKYDLIVVPHRSIRSAVITWCLKPFKSIGFNKSTGRFLFTDVVSYNSDVHETERNLSLLSPLIPTLNKRDLPKVYPSAADKTKVDAVLDECRVPAGSKYIAIAPGTIWNTKRWPEDRFTSLCKRLSAECTAVFLLGGKEDETLCGNIVRLTGARNAFSLAGKLSLLQSAECIRRSRVLISNDSAPMHLAAAVGTPVVAIFGATVPEFGFAPSGPNDLVLEIQGLPCRPCSIHGGPVCPIKTFDCMLKISTDMVYEKVKTLL